MQQGSSRSKQFFRGGPPARRGGGVTATEGAVAEDTSNPTHQARTGGTGASPTSLHLAEAGLKHDHTYNKSVLFMYTGESRGTYGGSTSTGDQVLAGRLKHCMDNWKVATEEIVSARALSHPLGKMNATAQVIPPAPLFCSHLQMDLAQALERGNQCYETQLTLSPEAREELVWWDTHMSAWNGRSLLKRDLDLVIDSDASLIGWGATCQGKRTGGPWSHQESQMHINCLELLAATLAIPTFTKGRTQISVLLRIDNTTAVAYINNRGGTVSKPLVSLAKDL